MDNKQIRDLIEDVVSDVPDGLACYDAYEQGKCDEERRIYRALMAKFPLAVKPAVVPWEDSKIGDVVEINCQKNGLLLVNVCNGNDLRTSKRNGYCPKCSRCICVERTLRCPESPDVDDTPLCDCHPSDCDVYFTEVKE